MARTRGPFQYQRAQFLLPLEVNTCSAIEEDTGADLEPWNNSSNLPRHKDPLVKKDHHVLTDKLCTRQPRHRPARISFPRPRYPCDSLGLKNSKDVCRGEANGVPNPSTSRPPARCTCAAARLLCLRTHEDSDNTRCSSTREKTGCLLCPWVTESVMNPGRERRTWLSHRTRNSVAARSTSQGHRANPGRSSSSSHFPGDHRWEELAAVDVASRSRGE